MLRRKSSEFDSMTEEEFRNEYLFEPLPRISLKSRIKEEFRCSVNKLQNVFPISIWLRNYKVKQDLLSDILAGMTVAVMHIPHGLAYSQLGGVAPVIGLYMGVFPLMPYILMGTSRHISLGTFAVLCAMVGDVVTNNTKDHKEIDLDFALAIGSCCCLIVGVWQSTLSLLRLGSFTVYMSSALISGFTTGAAFHVLTYQLKDVLGISVISPSGPLKLIYYYKELYQNIRDSNMVSISMTLCFVAFLLIYNYGIKPVIQAKITKCKVPVPIELIAIVIGTIISYFMKLHENYGVRIVAHVPKGLPMPRMPSLHLIPKLIFESFPLAVVALSINLSMAKIFAKHGNYEISGRQEILAYGAANVFSSFFLCLPSAASLSRSVIQFASGGKTQLASFFSMIIMIFILLFMGPVFEPVPYCVLSAIVIVSIIGLLLQVRDAPKLFRLSFLDGLVWLTTFLGVIIIDIDYGLLLGFIASFGCIIIMSRNTRLFTLGVVRNDNLYLSLNNFRKATEIPNILIMKLIGGLDFANIGKIDSLIIKNVTNVTLVPNMSYAGAVILDFSGVSYVDPAGTNGLLDVWKTLGGLGFRFFLASCNVYAHRDLEAYKFFEKFPKENVFSSIHGAVNYATKVDLM